MTKNHEKIPSRQKALALESQTSIDKLKAPSAYEEAQNA